jgi:hypothetical protein
MFTDGNANCTPSWWERLATTSLLASQVSQFDVNHAQVTNGLDVAVGIKKGIISMSNPRYAEAWKLLGQLVSYSPAGKAVTTGAPTRTPPTAAEPAVPLIQGKVGMLWGGSWWIPSSTRLTSPQVRGVPEPPITTASSPLALEPPRSGSSAARKATASGASPPSADSTMTPAKTATVMNFMAWLLTPQHLATG